MSYNSCSFSFEVGGHESPAGLAIVAALRAFVLKLAAAGVAGSVFGRPKEIVGGGRDVMDDAARAVFSERVLVVDAIGQDVDLTDKPALLLESAGN